MSYFSARVGLVVLVGSLGAPFGALAEQTDCDQLRRTKIIEVRDQLLPQLEPFFDRNETALRGFVTRLKDGDDELAQVARERLRSFGDSERAAYLSDGYSSTAAAVNNLIYAAGYYYGDPAAIECASRMPVVKKGYTCVYEDKYDGQGFRAREDRCASEAGAGESRYKLLHQFPSYGCKNERKTLKTTFARGEIFMRIPESGQQAGWENYPGPVAADYRSRGLPLRKGDRFDRVADLKFIPAPEFRRLAEVKDGFALWVCTSTAGFPLKLGKTKASRRFSVCSFADLKAALASGAPGKVFRDDEFDVLNSVGAYSVVEQAMPKQCRVNPDEPGGDERVPASSARSKRR